LVAINASSCSGTKKNLSNQALSQRVTALGDARFTVEIIRGADKWTSRTSPTAVD
jgi:hypothetical protein